jgi:hypothetical protein
MESEIDLLKLRQAANAIFDRLDDLGVTKVTLREDADYYWEVPSDRLYNVREKQPQLDVGRLSDDLEFLSAILKDKKQAVSLMFIHLAPLLRYVGEEIGQ